MNLWKIEIDMKDISLQIIARLQKSNFNEKIYQGDIVVSATCSMSEICLFRRWLKDKKNLKQCLMIIKKIYQ